MERAVRRGCTDRPRCGKVARCNASDPNGTDERSGARDQRTPGHHQGAASHGTSGSRGVSDTSLLSSRAVLDAPTELTNVHVYEDGYVRGLPREAQADLRSVALAWDGHAERRWCSFVGVAADLV